MNEELKGYAKSKNVKLYEVGALFGYANDTAFSRILRNEFTAEQKAKFINLVDKIADARGKNEKVVVVNEMEKVIVKKKIISDVNILNLIDCCKRLSILENKLEDALHGSFQIIDEIQEGIVKVLISEMNLDNDGKVTAYDILNTEIKRSSKALLGKLKAIMKQDIEDGD